uniref:Uncharacterized protein n=1 Tax=Ficedula albicollis TaxID=59894 RepID=A0A803VJR3_FICAL
MSLGEKWSALHVLSQGSGSWMGDGSVGRHPRASREARAGAPAGSPRGGATPLTAARPPRRNKRRIMRIFTLPPAAETPPEPNFYDSMYSIGKSEGGGGSPGPAGSAVQLS